MTDICHETALRMYEVVKGESDEADPEETVQQMAAAVHEAMFRAGYCTPGCDSIACRTRYGTTSDDA